MYTSIATKLDLVSMWNLISKCSVLFSPQDDIKEWFDLWWVLTVFQKMRNFYCVHACIVLLEMWWCVTHSYISPVLCIKLGWKQVWVNPHTIRWSLKTAADKYLSLFYYFLACPCVTWSNFSMFPAWYQSYVCVTADHEQFNKLTLYYNEWMMAVTWAAPHKHCVCGHLWMCLCLPCLLLSLSLCRFRVLARKESQHDWAPLPVDGSTTHSFSFNCRACKVKHTQIGK